MSMTTTLNPLEVFDLLTTNIIIVNQSFMFRYANIAAQQLFSLSTHRLNELNLSTLLPYLSINLERLKQELAKHNHFIDNHVVFRQLTDEIYLTLNARLLADNTILLEFYPLNQHNKLAAEHLQQQQQNASQYLLKGLAHEIKNPLSALRGAAQLLERELTHQNDLQEYTSLIIEQADRLSNLVNRLLGPQQVTTKGINNIHQVTERIFKLVKIEKSDNILLLRDYDPSIPDFTFEPEQIEQVLLNITRNALQAVQAVQGEKQGKITIKTRSALQVTMHGKRHRLCAKICIQDNGVGVPDALQETLFYPMVSGHPNGTGLGLSIARNLTEQHQGKIEMSSCVGKTIFSLYLPIY